MANNRLYLYDPESGEKFMLAKSFANGWYIKNSESFVEDLEKWLDGKDLAASYGGTGSTSLLLIAEGDLPANTK
jgi:hypothetical protein